VKPKLPMPPELESFTRIGGWTNTWKAADGI